MKHSIYSGPEQEKKPKFIAAKVFIFTKAQKKQKKLGHLSSFVRSHFDLEVKK